MMNGTAIGRYVLSRPWPVRSASERSLVGQDVRHLQRDSPFFCPTTTRRPTHRQLTARITRWGRRADCPSRRPGSPRPHAGVVRRRPRRSLVGAETLTSYTDMDVMRRGRRRSRNVSIINLGLTFMPSGAYVATCEAAATWQC